MSTRRLPPRDDKKGAGEFLVRLFC